MKKAGFIIITALLCNLQGQCQNLVLPFSDNFENGLNGWLPSDDGQGTSWELGTPTTGFTIGAHSGNKCWDVNLNSSYQNNATCYLYTPVFDFTNTPLATISFWTSYRTEPMWDYLLVQYSVDNGDSWVFMPFPGLVDPDGYTKKWVQTSLSVSDLNGYPAVQFRFVFSSDATLTYDGFSIDDFSIQVEPLGVPVIESSDIFSLFPNPANGSFTIHQNHPGQIAATVSIFDLSGKEINRTKINSYSDTRIDIPALSPGTYLVSYSTDNATMFKRFLITDH